MLPIRSYVGRLSSNSWTMPRTPSATGRPTTFVRRSRQLTMNPCECWPTSLTVPTSIRTSSGKRRSPTCARAAFDRLRRRLDPDGTASHRRVPQRAHGPYRGAGRRDQTIHRGGPRHSPHSPRGRHDRRRSDDQAASCPLRGVGRRADAAIQEVERLLADWADRHGHKTRLSAASRQFVTSDGSNVIRLYPAWGQIEFTSRTSIDTAPRRLASCSTP